MARTATPVLSLTAYCFICDRSLVDPTTREPIRVTAPSIRAGACTECSLDQLIYLGPLIPFGAPSVPSRS